jgi:hypothetical protein
MTGLGELNLRVRGSQPIYWGTQVLRALAKQLNSVAKLGSFFGLD